MFAPEGQRADNKRQRWKIEDEREGRGDRDICPGRTKDCLDREETDVACRKMVVL